MKQNYLLLVLLVCGLLPAQESINASGGNATGTGGSVAYSLGEIAYSTYTGTTGTLSEGTQHAYEVYSLGVATAQQAISLSVFPNPTADYLTLQVGNYNTEKMTYQLFNIQGQVVSSGQLEAQQTPIDMSGLPAATYFVTIVNQANKKLQSFKVVKK